MVAFLYCPKLENKLDTVVSHINFYLKHSKHSGQCKCALKCIHLATNLQLIPLYSCNVTQNTNMANFVCYGKTRSSQWKLTKSKIENTYIYHPTLLQEGNRLNENLKECKMKICK